MKPAFKNDVHFDWKLQHFQLSNLRTPTLSQGKWGSPGIWSVEKGTVKTGKASSVEPSQPTRCTEKWRPYLSKHRWSCTFLLSAFLRPRSSGWMINSRLTGGTVLQLKLYRKLFIKTNNVSSFYILPCTHKNVGQNLLWSILVSPGVASLNCRVTRLKRFRAKLPNRHHWGFSVHTKVAERM